MSGLKEPLQLIRVKDGLISLDLRDASASLQDLLDCWQPLCDNTDIYKRYAAGNYAACRACRQNCCLAADISPDWISLRRLTAGLKVSIPQFLECYCDARSLEHGLIKIRSNPCVFLKDNICTVYSWRTLLCLFYICGEIEGTTQELIYRCSLLGVVAAHHHARRLGLIPAVDFSGLGSFDREFLQMMEAQTAHPAMSYFIEAKEYSEIPLSVLV